MKLYLCSFVALTIFITSCSGGKDADREFNVPVASENSVASLSSESMISTTTIDPGDVDSGIFINAKLMPESESDTVSAEYIETMRGTLSMAIITVKPPFSDTLLVEFEISPNRDFAERPVVMRVQAYRDDKTLLGEEQGYVLGENATQHKQNEKGGGTPRIFVVDALEGLTETPETVLVYAKANAWLMPTGTDETGLEPLTASSPDRVAIMSNPVRINFEKEGLTQ